MAGSIHGWGPAFALALFLCPGGVQAQEPDRAHYVLDVINRLQDEIAARRGNTPQGEAGRPYFAEVNYLPPGGARDLPLATRGGTDDLLTVSAFCDQDCDGLRLSIYENGQWLASSDGAGVATLTFRRDGSRDYAARVEMQACRATICFIAVGAFQR